MDLHHEHLQQKAWRGAGVREGEDIERAAFGSPNIQSRERVDKYLPFHAAVEYVKKHQPQFAQRPQAASRLRQYVAGFSSDTSQPIKFFTAVGTPLDTFHGIDAFVEQGGVIATIDISARDKEIQKADVLLAAHLTPDGTLNISDTELIRVAKELAAVIEFRKRKIA